ncbi:MAG: hypothetical protein GJ680_00735 [Alteromonadaceae bacterium]|nr:hypothetical protein [Alteromonadaceae bacterium]
MACLTRNLQKQLQAYIKRHVATKWLSNPAPLRDDLIDKGICPSDVTYDQFEFLVETID